MKEEFFNRRPSRTRLVVENAYGMLLNRWKVLLSTIALDEQTIEKITYGCEILHDYLLTKKNSNQCFLYGNHLNSNNFNGKRGDA